MREKIIHVLSGRDNVIRLRLTNGGVAANLAAVTRFLLILDSSTEIDSQVELTAFDASPGDGELELKLGTLNSPPSAGDYTGAKLVTFDASNPNGVVWDDELHVRF